MIIGKCTSCGGNIDASSKYSVFKCPSCKEEIIMRCENCKAHGNHYVCPKCGFEGP